MTSASDNANGASRPVQFTLRDLLLATSVFALVLGIAAYLESPAEVRVVVAAIVTSVVWIAARSRSIGEGLMAVVLVFFSLLLLAPDNQTLKRWEMERRVRDWLPTDTAPRPPEHLLAPRMDLRGKWETKTRRHRSCLSVEVGPSGQYSVTIQNGPCQFERSGRFEHGVLTLDQPVAEHAPRVTYRDLYAVATDREEFLVPSPFVQLFMEGLLSADTEVLKGPAVWFVFQHASSKSQRGPGLDDPLQAQE